MLFFGLFCSPDKSPGLEEPLLEPPSQLVGLWGWLRGRAREALLQVTTAARRLSLRSGFYAVMKSSGRSALSGNRMVLNMAWAARPPPHVRFSPPRFCAVWPGRE